MPVESVWDLVALHYRVLILRELSARLILTQLPQQIPAALTVGWKSSEIAISISVSADFGRMLRTNAKATR